MMTKLEKIVIIGAGTMGVGIAQVAAMSGFKVVLFDIETENLPKDMQRIARRLDKSIEKQEITQEQKKDILSRIDATTFFGDLYGDFIIEAIVEDLNIKMEILRQTARLNKRDVILASNTSSIPITRLAAHLPFPERVVGMHFFNPAHIMPLVEVVAGIATNKQTLETTQQLVVEMQKTPVLVKDSAGFLVNRVNRHYYLQALQLLEEQVADIETIDALLESAGFKMGTFKLIDLIGLDSNHRTSKSIYESFFGEARFKPSRFEQQKVEAGHLGRKSGKGFYDYE